MTREKAPQSRERDVGHGAMRESAAGSPASRAPGRGISSADACDAAARARSPLQNRACHLWRSGVHRARVWIRGVARGGDHGGSDALRVSRRRRDVAATAAGDSLVKVRHLRHEDHRLDTGALARYDAEMILSESFASMSRVTRFEPPAEIRVAFPTRLKNRQMATPRCRPNRARRARTGTSPGPRRRICPRTTSGWISWTTANAEGAFEESSA